MPRRPSQPRPGPLRRIAGFGLLSLMLLVLLLVGAAFLVQSRLDPEALRAQVIQAVFQRTGRTLSIGRMQVRLLPVPSVEADDLSLADMAGGARDAMLTTTHLSAHLALWPLLHDVVELDGVALTAPDLLLERQADGSANWTPHPPTVTHTTDNAGGPSSNGAHWRLVVGSVAFQGGKIAWTDRQQGWTGGFELDRLDATGLEGDSPVVDLTGRHDAARFTLRARTGSLSRLNADTVDPAQPWPLHLLLTAHNDQNDVRLTLDGVLADPKHGRGAALDISLHADHPDGLDALFPKANIPAFGPVSLDTRLVDTAASSAPAPSWMLQRLDLHLSQVTPGRIIPGAWSQGLVLDHLDAKAAGPATPLTLSTAGSWRQLPFSAEGTAGTLQGWIAGISSLAGRGPSVVGGETAGPVDLALRSGVTQASLKGTAGPSTATLALQLTSPSLSLPGAPEPLLTDLAMSTRIAMGPDRTIALSGLSMRSHELGLSGALRLDRGPQPKLSGSLAASHVDLDRLRPALRLAIPPDPASPPPASPASSASPASPGLPAPAASPPIPATPPTAPTPDAEPYALLKRQDLTLTLQAAELRLDGDLYHQLAATVSLQAGVLSVTPFSATSPAGPISGTLGADAGQHTLTLELHPAMLPATTLARWFGRPPLLDGVVEIVASLKASGSTRAAWLASATGQAGLSMVDGSIANAALSQLTGRSGVAPDAGRTGFRCVAVPARLDGGTATLGELALVTSRLSVTGSGGVHLEDGALDLHLLPHLSLGSTGATLPVRVGGTLNDPVAALDPAAPGGRFSLTIGGAGVGGGSTDPCATDLAAARFGTAGPLPGAAPATSRHKLPKPIDILRGLGLFH